MADYINNDLLDALAFVESSNNPNAVNKSSGARGMYQFLPIAWQDVQMNYPQYKSYDYNKYVFDPAVARQFAEALLNLNAKRLGSKATIDNLLASYNYGIGHVMKGDPLPKETVNYIQKVKGRIKPDAVSGSREYDLQKTSQR